MKRLLAVFLIAACASAGCIDLQQNKDEGFKATLATATQKPAQVYPNQITDGNAHAMARALEAEMDFDEQQPPPPHAP